MRSTIVRSVRFVAASALAAIGINLILTGHGGWPVIAGFSCSAAALTVWAVYPARENRTFLRLSAAAWLLLVAASSPLFTPQMDPVSVFVFWVGLAANLTCLALPSTSEER